MAGSLAQAGMPLYLAAGGVRCAVTNTRIQARPAGGFEGYVEGIVGNEDTGSILAGAFLQVIGTPYVTFSDGRGHYRLGFEAQLVDGCRTQLVRVPRADSTIDMAQRR